jgi:phosphatidylinositol alpha-1,6-mannosyltransferase
MARRLVVTAQNLKAGQGGIGRVARLSVMALERRTDLRALAVEDDGRHSIGRVEVKPCYGSRTRFLFANSALALGGSNVLYDFAGTARANLPGLNLRSSSAVWIHGYELWNPDGVRADYVKAVRRADLILANSNYTLSRIEATIGALPAARVCWLGTEQDEPAVQPRRNNIPTLLFLGRNDEMFAKGQDILIDVWPDVVSRIPRARLVFAGGGTHLPTLIELARTSSVSGNIDVLGFLPDAELENVWRTATAFAMLSYVEGFGLVFAEAMRHGLPVLASDDDASQEVNVDGVTGFNVSRADRSGIVDRIVALLGEPERAAVMGEAGLDRWRKNFCFSAFEARLGSIIEPWLQS